YEKDRLAGTKYIIPGKCLVKLFFSHESLFKYEILDSLTCLERFLVNFSCLQVADIGSEQSYKHRTLINVRSKLALVCQQAVNHIGGKDRQKVLQHVGGIEHTQIGR